MIFSRKQPEDPLDEQGLHVEFTGSPFDEAFAGVNNFIWRNPICTNDEIAAVRRLRPARDLQFKIVHHSSDYISD